MKQTIFIYTVMALAVVITATGSAKTVIPQGPNAFDSYKFEAKQPCELKAKVSLLENTKFSLSDLGMENLRKPHGPNGITD